MIDEKNYTVAEDEEEEDYIPMFAWHREDYIKENKPEYYNSLVENGTLKQEMKDFAVYVTKIYDSMLEDMLKKEGVNNELKKKDMFRWVGLYNNCAHTVSDYIMREYVLV